jgi:putative transcriptional regulator
LIQAARPRHGRTSVRGAFGGHVMPARLLQQRGMTLTELADEVGFTVVNLSVLKDGRARAIRFSTLAALCDALGCQPGDLLSHQP